MRILFIASLHHPGELARTARGAGDDDPLFPASQEHYFWVRALRRLGHTCEVFWRSARAWPWPSPRGLRMSERLTAARAISGVLAAAPGLDPDRRLRNRRLLRAAEAFGPDVLVLVGNNSVVFPATLETLKRTHGARLVYACGDSPAVFSHRTERAAAPLYDLVVANDAHHAQEWVALGARSARVLPTPGIDPVVHRRYELTSDERARYVCDVAFVGTLVPSRLYSRRVAALEALRDLDLAIWSVHEVPGSLRRCHRGPLLGTDMLRALSAAKIVPNPNGDTMRDGANMRLFETCGAGALQMVDERPGVHQWFTPGEHLVTYRDPPNLRSLVLYYLAHDEARTRIATAGLAHVRAHHTYDHRMVTLMRLVADLPRAEDPGVPR